MTLITGNNRIKRPGELPALVLAYVGDAVFELLVREHLVAAGLVRVERLHDETVKFVQAAAQARTLRALEGTLTEEEQAVVRRGRNAKSSHTPRSAGVLEYRHSTALESLVGYLYLKGDAARLNAILAAALKTGEESP